MGYIAKGSTEPCNWIAEFCRHSREVLVVLDRAYLDNDKEVIC